MFTKILNSWLTKPTAMLLALSIFLMSFTPYVPPTGAEGNGDDIEGGVILKAGTTIPLQTLTPLSSATLQTGQTVTFNVASDIKVNGKVVIERGAAATGTVVSAQHRRMIGLPGKFMIKINTVTAVDGTNVFLTNSDINAEGKSKLVTSLILTGVLCWLFALMKGEDAVSNSGITNVAVATDTEIQVN